MDDELAKLVQEATLRGVELSKSLSVTVEQWEQIPSLTLDEVRQAIAAKNARRASIMAHQAYLNACYTGASEYEKEHMHRAADVAARTFELAEKRLLQLFKGER